MDFQASELVALADSILRDYMAESSLANLNTAIYFLAQTWVNQSPQDSECLNLLATALLTRFSYTGQWTDVQIACMIHGVVMKVLSSEGLGVLTVCDFIFSSSTASPHIWPTGIGG